MKEEKEVQKTSVYSTSKQPMAKTRVPQEGLTLAETDIFMEF
jgi:hypothetical protein